MHMYVRTLVCPPPPLAARSDRYNNDNLSEEEEVVENDDDGRNPFIKFDSQSRRMSILLSDWSLNSSFDSQDETKRKFSEASSTTVTSEEGRLVDLVTLAHRVHSHTTRTHHIEKHLYIRRQLTDIRTYVRTHPEQPHTLDHPEASKSSDTFCKTPPSLMGVSVSRCSPV